MNERLAKSIRKKGKRDEVGNAKCEPRYRTLFLFVIVIYLRPFVFCVSELASILDRNPKDHNLYIMNDISSLNDSFSYL